MRRTLPYFSKLAQPANQALEEMLSEARREILVHAAVLDFNVFRSESIVDIIKKMLTRYKESSIKILVDDDKEFVNKCVRLAETARRIPTIVEVRKSGPECDPATQVVVIVDASHTFVQKYDSRDSFHVYEDERSMAYQYRREFTSLWSQSIDSDEVKSLAL